MFGVILQGTAPTGSLAGYRLDAYLLIVVALLSVVLAMNLPGPMARHVDTK